MESKHTILVLGGYGFFGQRIAAGLTAHPNIRLLLAGRRLDEAKRVALALQLPESSAIQLDTSTGTLANSFAQLGVQTVIHTAGPFQGQDYGVARAAIAAKSNYIDIADGRQFVSEISTLDSLARAAGVTIVSGASSLPALSSAVVERYLPLFSRLDAIRIGIASGARAPGIATVRGIFGYCGKAFQRLQNGANVVTHGWLDLHRHRFPPPVGVRLLGSCDVPDLDLLPKQFPSVHTVTFHAGFASHVGHMVVWSLALLVKLGLMRSATPFAGPLNALSRWIEPFVSDKGGMFVRLEGLGLDGNAMQKAWYLVAAQNHGPHVPCGAAIALAKRFAEGRLLKPGATPCVGMLSVKEYLDSLRDLDVHEIAP
jgi:saccharopine dehydrogenase-like NADP-dependent oxidoreductase